MNRRSFFKMAGMGGLSFAAGCTSKPEKEFYSLVRTPEDRVTGEATWYASTCRECPAGCGVLAKNREGRVIKLEGNPYHPINRGRLCMRGQAALQGIYNPDRIETPLLKEKDQWQPISFHQAEDLLVKKILETSRKGPNHLGMLTETVGPPLLDLIKDTLLHYGSAAPLIFEPFGYESLKAANQMVFGVHGLPSYRMEKADLLLSFGADFMETWLSPVEYSRKFKAMHTLQGMKKALFFHVSPLQSMTGANADVWISCKPSGEVFIALGLLRGILWSGRGSGLPRDLRAAMEAIAEPFTRERALEYSGSEPEVYDKLLHHLLRSQKPLILGSGNGKPGHNGVQTDITVNLLNLVLDPRLALLDFKNRHGVEMASRRSEVLDFLKALEKGAEGLLLLNNVNPVYVLPTATWLKDTLERDTLFVVSFSNFIDETTDYADLILPTALPLESWDAYGGKSRILSTQQPTMSSLTQAPGIGDVFLRLNKKGSKFSFRDYLMGYLTKAGKNENERTWLETLQRGGQFDNPSDQDDSARPPLSDKFLKAFESPLASSESEYVFFAAPSLRFFDGRGANRPWLCEVPDPLNRVAWQGPVRAHPDTLKARGLKEGDVIHIETDWGSMEAPVYDTWGVRPGLLVMDIGQGHSAYGRYAEGIGFNPFRLLSPESDGPFGVPVFFSDRISIHNVGQSMPLARTDGSRFQYGRKIALTIPLEALREDPAHEEYGLSMQDFPLTLPIEEGYDRSRDVYLPHEHDTYRWAMVVDLDRCIGCGACTVACYAENNIGVVGFKNVLDQREMSWLTIERYLDPLQREKVTFLPMLCQHCDNAPCESVCPVYASHHSKEGLNNQIYNRCIGTRFCGQNCPYKARRFNWFDWKRPEPLPLQLNPDVTVRSKGVMEKCSFCIQRIKEAHGNAKDESRPIRDGEVVPACVQTCPTGVFTFGNLKDKNSQVRRLTDDKRAYQVMGYLNTKPAVIYLKKVRQEI